jgi:hypothetical protein
LALNVRNWLDALRAIDRFLELETKHGKLIDAQAERLDNLENRINRLEAREPIVIAEAKGAAASAASVVAAQQLGDLARHVGGMEERVKRLEQERPANPRLPAPPASNRG